MFTGIVERTGMVRGLSFNKLKVEAGQGFSVKPGDSVCVNGVCLTVSEICGSVLSFDISAESSRVTNFKDILVNDIVNLERALPSDGRFGGHFVTGHVDSIGKVKNIVKNGTTSIDVIIEFDNEYAKFLVNKGSICVNGTSLTVNEINGNTFRLTLIPYTLKETNLLELKIGARVNIEYDVIAKYVSNMLFSGSLYEVKGSTLTEEKLRSLGYVK